MKKKCTEKVYLLVLVFFCSPTTAYFLTIGTLSGQEPPGFAVQASKKKWIFKKSGFSKSRVFSRVNRKSTGGVTPGPMPKKAEVDYIFSQKAGGARILVIFWFCYFFLVPYGEPRKSQRLLETKHCVVKEW
jgi:hypothetical protein